MKLAITGKGGVGKTTLASILCRIYAAEGYQVLAVDANPDANLGVALGIPEAELATLTPIAEMEDLVEERTGARPGSQGGFLKLNPVVSDIPDRFCARKDGVKLLLLGTVKKGGGGCICPESVLLRGLIRHLILGRSEVVILDMDAGVEHLGRGTAQGVDAFIAVVEPGRRSLQTAAAIQKLARDLGVETCYLVGNKVRGEGDIRFLEENLARYHPLGFISYSPEVARSDLQGLSPFDTAPQAVAEVRAIKARLEGQVQARKTP